MHERIIIGTRGSNLALAQARIAADRMTQAHPGLETRLQIITTTGDRNQRSTLAQIGGKGVFVKELEQALLDRSIDVAVHSFKDITSSVPPELDLCAFFSPESVCDVLVSKNGTPLRALPQGALIGTGSMRRRALLARMRPDLRFADMRGNIETRISKMERGEVDAIVLSEAGLIRLELTHKTTERFDPLSFYPAPGQGVIALEIRRQDHDLRALCQRAGDPDQSVISRAELSLLRMLGFDCRTPLGVHARRCNGNTITMNGFYVRSETGAFVERSIAMPATSPEAVGEAMARLLLNEGADP